MKIELTKEESVNKKTGDPEIWFWVRSYEGEHTHVRECFYEEETARVFYEGCKQHYLKHGTYAPAKEVILSESVYHETVVL
jgi:hypothetical protein